MMVKNSDNHKEEVKQEPDDIKQETGAKEVDPTDENKEAANDQHEDDHKDTSTEKAKKKKNRKARKEEEEIKELKLKIAELNDKHLRLFSEFDNFRKRTIRERIELTTTASEEVIKDLLPVLDDFDRAIKALDETDKIESLKEGINLIHNKFKSTLSAKGLKPMKAIGETFDTDFHEAVTEIPAPDKKLKGKNVDEIEKGYLLGDKVIRYAKVVVGS